MPQSARPTRAHQHQGKPVHKWELAVKADDVQASSRQLELSQDEVSALVTRIVRDEIRKKLYMIRLEQDHYR